MRKIFRANSTLHNLRRIYIARQTILHGECFYYDDCAPDETEELIRETMHFIRGAETLAKG